jgi:hypothetical protein
MIGLEKICYNLNISKTHCINFTTKITRSIVLNMNHENKAMPTTNKTELLCLLTDYTLSWEKHINEITNKLNTVCYLLQNIKSFM